MQEIVFAFLARDDEFEGLFGAYVAANLEQHDVVEFVFAPAAVVPQVTQLDRIALIGQKTAAAGRLRVLLETELARQRHLRLARAPGEVLQLRPVDPAFALGQGFFQVQRAKRPQQAILGARFARNDRHGALALRHRSLADDFAGDDKIETVGVDPLQCLADHEDLAIEAGIEVGAITVPGIEHDVLVFIDNVDDMQPDVELLGDP